MGWAKFDDGYMDHPKIMEAGYVAELLDRRAIEHCAKYETDGLITASGLRRIGRDIPKLKARVQALVNVGRWTENATGGWWVHDFLKFNPSHVQKEDEREKARARMAGLRSGRSSGGSSPRSSDYSRGGRDGILDEVKIKTCAACGRETPCHCPSELEVARANKSREAS